MPETLTTDVKRKQALREAATALYDAEKPIRVLRYISWPPHVARKFLAGGAQSLPRVRYTPPNMQKCHEAIAHARSLLKGQARPERWLRRAAQSIELSARMLRAAGTAEFHRLSCRLYGTPTTPLVDGQTTVLDLARRVDRILSRMVPEDLGPPLVSLSATALAARMRAACKRVMGDRAPRVEVVEHLSARATADPHAIKLRQDAPFNEADVQQLIMHEAMIHVVTALNGLAQRALPVLGARHAGTTRTQEGLAVFSELISGGLTPGRFRRLANRVLAVQMSMDGADFIEVYRFFLDRTGEPAESFEDARRIFRGGLPGGGAPFTKDSVYLDGLVRVHNFLRALIELHRSDLLPLLFCGRLDIEDIPDIAWLATRGLIQPPELVPPWARDRRFLVAYLTYSGFLNRVHLRDVRSHYAALLAGCRASEGVSTAPRGTR